MESLKSIMQKLSRIFFEGKGEWYCENFLKWFGEVIEKKGRLD